MTPSTKKSAFEFRDRNSSGINDGQVHAYRDDTHRKDQGWTFFDGGSALSGPNKDGPATHRWQSQWPVRMAGLVKPQIGEFFFINTGTTLILMGQAIPA
jgi:hypothetical protein